MLLWSSQIEGKPCDSSGIEVLIGCIESIDKEIKPPPTPAEGCCVGLRYIGMKCVCEVITKEVEATVDMQKLVKLATYCGRPLAPHTQCGSYLVPPVAL
ncbi:unnamed protein product [Microthlaspi erraticum]|uniref:Bifunctional inhibitor/plant lipid transfer protein/seed storage helical domain-containing protein n=1 Tax=Microthlaspi erraticum TaxID=1685480 RepID=A0A6D2LM34_9BRAS|nr:unnamed protein product [Microthlaspi erraticum]